MQNIRPFTSDDMFMKQVDQALRMTPEERLRDGSRPMLPLMTSPVPRVITARTQPRPT
jgi:hypothetical protein